MTFPVNSTVLHRHTSGDWLSHSHGAWIAHSVVTVIANDQPNSYLVVTSLGEPLVVKADELDDPTTTIKNTAHQRQYPWPPETFIQGSQHALTKSNEGDEAFVEVSLPQVTYFRFTAPTVPEAETKAWNYYQKLLACPHPSFEPRHRTNGSGYCIACNAWFSQVCSESNTQQPPTQAELDQLHQLAQWQQSATPEQVKKGIAAIFKELLPE